MNYIHSVILGIIEGITEFLPISSTGHLILAEKILQIPSSEFWKSFDIFIQLGAILAVVVLYWKRIWENKNIIGKIIAAFIPTAIIGLTFYKIVKEHLLGNSNMVLWSLLIGGFAIIIIEQWYKKKTSEKMETQNLNTISYKQSIIIGLFQSVSIIPGVSRAAATIMGGLLLKIPRTAIVEFSFLLAIPTMAAATGLDLIKTEIIFSSEQWVMLIIGFVTSFIVAMLVIRFFLSYIKKNDFKTFGWYRIILAIIGFFLI